MFIVHILCIYLHCFANFFCNHEVTGVTFPVTGWRCLKHRAMAGNPGTQKGPTLSECKLWHIGYYNLPNSAVKKKFSFFINDILKIHYTRFIWLLLVCHIVSVIFTHPTFYNDKFCRVLNGLNKWASRFCI